MSDVTLTLGGDEALVLFELLHRWEASGWYRTSHFETGERTALWNLSAILETLMVEPFDPNYDDLLTAARERLREITM